MVRNTADKKAFTLVELMIVLAIIAIIAAFAIPNLMKSRMSANETGAVGGLRTLMSAEETYMNRYGIYGTLAQLATENLIDNSIAGGKKSGYFYGEIATGANYSYCFGAIPVEDGRSGAKEYVLTQKGTIYESNLTSTLAAANTTWGTEGSLTDGVPSQFTASPEGDTTNWKPIME